MDKNYNRLIKILNVFVKLGYIDSFFYLNYNDNNCVKSIFLEKELNNGCIKYVEVINNGSFTFATNNTNYNVIINFKTLLKHLYIQYEIDIIKEKKQFNRRLKIGLNKKDKLLEIKRSKI